MFERCDEQTMMVFEGAVAEARRLGHNYVGTEHLLVALVQHRHLLPEPVAALLPELEVLHAALASAMAGPPTHDAELLQTLGIDLDHVRSAVRATFGDEATERLGRRQVHQPWQPWRRPTRRCMSVLAGAMGVAPRAKQAFEEARLDADRRQRPAIDPAGLLLGMVEVEDAMSNRLLQDIGIDPSRVRRALLDSAG